ncbi:hypothetical protein BpHYR1_035082 [Brachionus plicatilis]|uniref:Uncharacterized protein n=1 Tax=Brachionus plicatilis TaxID=10195 RepID=A0A3M7SZS0_BRAPC|nr:hypothetical protein BpHYR1_035082 [Brachionus plicatilis]
MIFERLLFDLRSRKLIRIKSRDQISVLKILLNFVYTKKSDGLLDHSLKDDQKVLIENKKKHYPKFNHLKPSCEKCRQLFERHQIKDCIFLRARK